jgi:hypothetical protein
MGAWLMARIEDTAYGEMVAQTKKKTTPTPQINSSLARKATGIMEADIARTDAYQTALTAPAKTAAEVANINADVKAITESTGNVYDSSRALTVGSQATLNPAVVSTNNFSPDAAGKKTAFDQDAFAKLMAQLNQWNLGSLSGVITQLLEEGNTFDSVLTKIKYDSSINVKTGKAYNDAYTIRFAGNKSRISKGLNALSEQEYMQNENSYAETLKAYGLNTMLSTDRSVNEAKFAGYIANDMSPSEFKDRIDLASTRVMNMDPAIMRNFQQYYPQVNKTDLVSYFLAPEETMQLLETKVTASEIGAAANQQGLSVGGTRAEEFAKMGLNYAQAQRDYSNIAEVLPTTEKLGGIYGEEGIKYTQATAEDEYIKQDAAAKLKRNRLASKERASFEGSAGAAQGAFSTSYLKKSSAAGQI